MNENLMMGVFALDSEAVAAARRIGQAISAAGSALHVAGIHVAAERAREQAEAAMRPWATQGTAEAPLDYTATNLPAADQVRDCYTELLGLVATGARSQSLPAESETPRTEAEFLAQQREQRQAAQRGKRRDRVKPWESPAKRFR